MTKQDKEKIAKLLIENLRTHTDWTGTYVENAYKCDSVADFIRKLFNAIEEDGYNI